MYELEARKRQKEYVLWFYIKSKYYGVRKKLKRKFRDLKKKNSVVNPCF